MTRTLIAFITLSLSAISVACSDSSESATTTTQSSAGGSGAGSSSGGMGTGADGATGGASSGGGGGGTAGSGGTLDCTDLPMGPITATEVSTAFDGSEDLAFDGKGNLVAKNGDDIIELDASGGTTTLATVAGTVLGLRFLSDGTLVAARSALGRLDAITQGGDVTTYITLSGSPNGVFADFEGNLWVTRFAANEVVKILPDMTTVEPIASGADANSANGVVRHPTLNWVYYTEYSEARIHRVDITAVTPVPEQIAEVTAGGAALDGMTMDACGNLYIVDNGNNDIYRLELDATGAAIGTPVLLSTTAQNIANAQFGSGTGWNTTSLYASGFPGVVYEIPVGVPGAPVPTVP